MASTTRPSNPQHLSWVDIARGLGIISVVLWHTAGGILRRDPSPELNQVIDAWDAYAYRAMPLFFLLSGMFVVGSLRRSNRDFVESKLRTLLWPYLVWSLLSVAAGTIAGAESAYGIGFRDLPRLLYDPLLQYWFLYALFVVMLGYLVLYRAAVSPRGIVIICGALYVVTVVLDAASPSYVLTQIGLFAIYFALGAWLRSPLTALVDRVSKPVLVGVSSLAAALLALLVWGGPLPPPVWLPSLSATVATVGFIALAEVLAGDRLGRAFGQLGRYSLQIYVAQVIFASAARVVLSKVGIDDFWPQFIVASSVGIFGPLGLAMLTERIHFPYLWTWPQRGRSQPQRSAHADLSATAGQGLDQS